MKVTTYLKTLVLLSFTCLAMTGYGQETESVKKQQRSYYRNTLQVDSVKAEEVRLVQDSYKINLKLIMADTTVTPAGRVIKIQELMDLKNQHLRKLLTPAQQEKIIPLAERMIQPAKKD